MNKDDGIRLEGRGQQEAAAEFLRQLEAAYPEPDAFETADEWARACHEDIMHLSLEEIDRERIRALVKWGFSAEPSSWLEERLKRLDQAAARLRQEDRR